jgi:hypothetical protein
MDLPENIVAGLMGLLNRTITVIEKQTELITNQLIHMANEPWWCVRFLTEPAPGRRD